MLRAIVTKGLLAAGALFAVTLIPSAPVEAATPRVCTADYRPVCGRDRITKRLVTYGNKCVLRAERARFVRNGPCRKD